MRSVRPKLPKWKAWNVPRAHNNLIFNLPFTVCLALRTDRFNLSSWIRDWHSAVIFVWHIPMLKNLYQFITWCTGDKSNIETAQITFVRTLDKCTDWPCKSLVTRPHFNCLNPLTVWRSIRELVHHSVSVSLFATQCMTVVSSSLLTICLVYKLSMHIKTLKTILNALTDVS